MVTSPHPPSPESSAESSESSSPSGKTYIGHKILIGISAVIVLIILYSVLPIGEWVDAFRMFVKGLGTLGVLLYVFVYAGVCFFLIPGSILTLAAGVIWGLGGFPIVMMGAILGSGISFLAARHFFRDWVKARIKEHPRFLAVNDAIGDEGWRVVILMRLSPALPFSLQNWFLGITPVNFWPAQIATFVGIMPGTLAYVWIGSLGGHIADSTDTSFVRWLLLGIGFIATVLVTLLVTRTASNKLKEYDVS